MRAYVRSDSLCVKDAVTLRWAREHWAELFEVEICGAESPELILIQHADEDAFYVSMVHLWEHLSEDQQVCSISCGLELPETERESERQTQRQGNDREDGEDSDVHEQLHELDSMMGGLGIAHERLTPTACSDVSADMDHAVASQDRRRRFKKKNNRVLLSDSESDEETNEPEDNVPHSPKRERDSDRGTERQSAQSDEAQLLIGICNAAEGSPARTNVSSVRATHCPLFHSFRHSDLRNSILSQESVLDMSVDLSLSEEEDDDSSFDGQLSAESERSTEKEGHTARATEGDRVSGDGGTANGTALDLAEDDEDELFVFGTPARR